MAASPCSRTWPGLLVRKQMNQMLSKGIEHRQLAVAWAVLSHDLWVIARLPEKEQPSERTAA
jgi:hypothetical protein